MWEVVLMNEKQAIAYGQIALDSLLHSTYKGKVNLENFGLEMKNSFKLYPRNISIQIADAKIYAEKKIAQEKRSDLDAF